MTITLDTSLLLGYFQAKGALATGGSSLGSGTGSGGTKKYAPTAPWQTTSTAAKVSDLVKTALSGRRLIDLNAAQLDLPGASEDYRKLFTLYQGLNSLGGLAERAGAKGIPDYEMKRLQTVFAHGLAEVAGYADAAKFDQLRITLGQVGTSSKATTGVPRPKYDYTTDVLFTGQATDPVPAFQGAAAFDVQIKKLSATTNVSMDLAEMGATPRTMSNVVSYLNSKLQAAGVTTRFAIQRTPGAERKSVGANGQPITLPALGDNYALTVKGDTSEQLTFAATTKPAVYVTTYAGDPDPDKDTKTDDGKFESKLLKMDPAGATGPETRIHSETLEGTLKTIRSTKVGADGSVYMLADVEKSVSGQQIKGETDAALLKYDSVGNLLYARTLGAADEATGLSLAVAADGRVAIAGAVTGALNGATNGPINSGEKSDDSDSFVTVFDAKGDELWTMRRGSLGVDEADAVAFGDDDIVYVAGRTKSTMPTATGGANGGFDGYLTAYSANATNTPKALFTQQFGTTGDDKPAGLVVNGSQVLVASNENGSGVLRSFDVSSTQTKTIRSTTGGVLTNTVETYVNGALTDSQTATYNVGGDDVPAVTKTFTSLASAAAGATRNIGSLAGGTIAGIALEGGNLFIAGQTRNGALGLGPATNAYTGALDAYAGRLSTDLSSTAADALAYYGGAGDNTVVGMSVAGGKVYVAGAAGADLPGLTAQGTKEGYIAGIDVATGAISGAQRISGKDGVATVTSIAVDATGVSALDKFGLPKGKLTYDTTNKVVSATSARAGDTFQIQTRSGSPVTITLTADDTLETLAATIRRKAGSNAKVEVVSTGTTRVLKISPSSDNAVVEIIPGKGGKDLLEALGLNEGIVRRTTIDDKGKTVSTASGGESYGLTLDLNLDFETPDGIKHAQAVLAAAMGKIRTAYKDLEAAAKPASLIDNRSADGPVPAYLQAQIANYQAGLNRLTGGG